MLEKENKEKMQHVQYMVGAGKEMYLLEGGFCNFSFAGRDMNPTFPGLCFSAASLPPRRTENGKLVFRSDFSKFPWGITLLD